MSNEKSIHWQQGAFIDSRKYTNMGNSWREQQIQLERCLVRPSPKGNPICKADHPDNALWIATRLNLVDEQQRELAAKDRKIAELEKRLSNAETMGDKAQAKRDLEQKLEAVNYIISHDSTKCKSKKSVDCNAIHLADLHNYAFHLEQQLREQAKGGDL